MKTIAICALYLALVGCTVGTGSFEDEADKGNRYLNAMNEMVPAMNDYRVDDLSTYSLEEIDSAIIECRDFLLLGEEALLIIEDSYTVYHGDESDVKSNLIIGSLVKSRLEKAKKFKLLEIEENEREKARLSAEQEEQDRNDRIQLEKSSKETGVDNLENNISAI